jgi:hypothetical protein
VALDTGFEMQLVRLGEGIVAALEDIVVVVHYVLQGPPP